MEFGWPNVLQKYILYIMELSFGELYKIYSARLCYNDLLED